MSHVAVVSLVAALLRVKELKNVRTKEDELEELAFLALILFGVESGLSK